MSNSIRSIIVSALPSGVEDSYTQYIDDVEKALTEAFTVISENVKDTVLANTSFTEDEVRQYGEQAGLIFRPIPEPVVEAPVEEDAEASGDADMNAKLDTILGLVTGLVGRTEKLENAARGAGLSL